MNFYLCWAITAPEDQVGPACSRVTVPDTIAMDETFREAYVQGYRHALVDVRKLLSELPKQPTPNKDVVAPEFPYVKEL